MRIILSKRISAALRSYASTVPRNRHSIATCTHRSRPIPFVRVSGGLLESPWSATQLRHARFSGADVRPGNVIERRGKIYEVVKADHTTQGRGGAIIQVELRDVDSGSKVNERLRTDEKIESMHLLDIIPIKLEKEKCLVVQLQDSNLITDVDLDINVPSGIGCSYYGVNDFNMFRPEIFVEEKSLTYLYTDDETGNIVLMEPDTYSQLEVPRPLFGDSFVYLQDDMTVTVQLYDDRPLSASIPHRVTCTVAESDEARPGSSKSSPSKRVLLDNGVTLQAPAHIAAGDKIVVNTTNSSYVSRA